MSSAFSDRLTLKVLAVLLAMSLWFLINGRERLENRRTGATPRREAAPAGPILPSPRAPTGSTGENGGSVGGTGGTGGTSGTGGTGGTAATP